MVAEISISVPTQNLLDELADLQGVRPFLWDMSGPAPAESIDIVVVPYLDGAAPLRLLGEIQTELVQWQSIGYDGVSDHLPAGKRFANAASVHETSTAELAVGLAIAAQRGIDTSVKNMGRGLWLPRFSPALADSRVLLVGYGGVSKAIESRLAPFEVQIQRVASRKREEVNLAGDEVTVESVASLASLVEDADVVILGLPLNPETEGLFNETMLSRMKKDALLVNVGRGGLVDTQALMGHLKAGRIRAALDVVDPEPLPEGHELWECPGLIITPHVGGDTAAMQPRMVALIKRQIEHLRLGEPFENLIDF